MRAREHTCLIHVIFLATKIVSAPGPARSYSFFVQIRKWALSGLTSPGDTQLDCCTVALWEG